MTQTFTLAIPAGTPVCNLDLLAERKYAKCVVNLLGLVVVERAERRGPEFIYRLSDGTAFMVQARKVVATPE